MLPPVPFTGLYAQDNDGFAPTDLGSGTFKYATFTFATPAGTTLFTLPAGATIFDWSLVIKVVFNAGSSNTLSVGTTGNATLYKNAQSVLGTLGPVYSINWLPGQYGVKNYTPQPITVTYAQTGTAATAGTAFIVCYYATN